MRDAQWIETTPQAGRGLRRAPRWILVPVVMIALTGVVLLLLAAVAALLTGGIAGMRERVRTRAGALRDRLGTLLRGRPGMPAKRD
jgi:hypothetical protein